MSPAEVAVLGPGGVGGLVAARTGAVCVGTERSVEVIRERGLTVVERDARTVTRHEAVTHLDRPVAVLVVAVKAYDLDDALARVAPTAIADAVVVPLLNGLEHVDRIGAAPTVPASAVVAAGSIARVEASAPAPGVVVLGATEARIAAASDELGPERLARALAPLAVPGLELVIGTAERAVLWEKAARLAALAAATVASGSSVGQLRDEPQWSGRLRAAVEEACAVAAADGVDLDPAGQWAIIGALAPELTTSAARDARAGRPTELDAITGAVCRAGLRLGVPTPTLEGLLAEAGRAVVAA